MNTIPQLLQENTWQSFNKAEQICINHLKQNHHKFSTCHSEFCSIQTVKYLYSLENIDQNFAQSSTDLNLQNTIDKQLFFASQSVSKTLTFLQIYNQFEPEHYNTNTTALDNLQKFTTYQKTLKSYRLKLSTLQRKSRESITSYISRQTTIIKKIAKIEQEKQPKNPILARFEYVNSKIDKDIGKIQVHLSYFRQDGVKFPFRERDQVKIMPEFLAATLKGSFPDNLSDLGTILSIRGKNWTRDATQVVLRCDSVENLKSLEEKEMVCLQSYVNDVISKRCLNCLDEIGFNQNKVVDKLLGTGHSVNIWFQTRRAVQAD